MDALKKAAGSLGGSGNKDKSGSEGSQNQNQNQDWLDKSWDAGTKKAGMDLDDKTDKKITDGMRDAYAKQSGNNAN